PCVIVTKLRNSRWASKRWVLTRGNQLRTTLGSAIFRWLCTTSNSFPAPWSTPMKTASSLMRETSKTSRHQDPTERSHRAAAATGHQCSLPPAEAQCRRQYLFRLLLCEPHQ